ncbi:hypothetical protein ARMGADRAFT_1035700 [Armillaria gallica]|uniref:Uncharacterized protein n=1 Tax=Armillaria gallica TaxID=47427 RepID=A0A2H3DAZ8_ARMGA|nr:hypothetical protein ARMGADRAFT_1035700 [Armillaria gallica]
MVGTVASYLIWARSVHMSKEFSLSRILAYRKASLSLKELILVPVRPVLNSAFSMGYICMTKEQLQDSFKEINVFAALFYIKCNYLKSYLCFVPIKLYEEEAGCRGRIEGQHKAATTGWGFKPSTGLVTKVLPKASHKRDYPKKHMLKYAGVSYISQRGFRSPHGKEINHVMCYDPSSGPDIKRGYEAEKSQSFVRNQDSNPVWQKH